MSLSALQKATVIVTCVVVTLLITPAISAQTADPKKGTLEVEPAYVDVTLEQADEEQTVDLYYTNHSRSPVTLDLTPVDFKQATDKGGISFLGKQADTYSYSLSSFLTFEQHQLLVQPGEKQKFSVKVRNRQDLSPGGHYAAVVARVISESKETVVSPALSSLIFMKKLGGEIYHLSLNDLDWPKNVVTMRIPKRIEVVFQNEGNVHVIPYGKVEIKDIFGRLVYTGILNNSSGIILPESRRLLTVELKSVGYNFPLAFNIFTLNGEDSLKKVRYSYQETFIYIHPAVLGFVPLVAFGLWLLVRRWKKKKGKELRITNYESSEDKVIRAKQPQETQVVIEEKLTKKRQKTRKRTKKSKLES